MDSSALTTNQMTTVKTDYDWFVSLMTIDLYAPIGNSSSVVTAADGTVKVTLPASLKSIADAKKIDYKTFSCARNLPRCTGNLPDNAECQLRCAAISTAIGEYSKQCLALKATAAAAGTAFNADCYTLKTLPDANGGCAEPWCKETANGTGIAGQGWTRDCVHLCKEASPYVPPKTSGAATVHSGATTALALSLVAAVLAQ